MSDDEEPAPRPPRGCCLLIMLVIAVSAPWVPQLFPMFYTDDEIQFYKLGHKIGSRLRPGTYDWTKFPKPYAAGYILGRAASYRQMNILNDGFKDGFNGSADEYADVPYQCPPGVWPIEKIVEEMKEQIEWRP